MMGSAAAFDLAGDPAIDELLLVDRELDRLRPLLTRLRDGGRADVETAVADLERSDELAPLLASVDVAAAAAPWRPTLAALHAATARRLPFASIARPDYGDLDLLRGLAERSGTPILLPFGLEPGLTEILARQTAEQLDRVDEISVRCGGIPARPRPPLGYLTVFGGDRLPLGLRAAFEIRNGELGAVPRFSGVEEVDVEGIGTLEAFHDGLPPWIEDDPVLGSVPKLTQKTLRWPGFAATVTRLGELGLLGESAVTVDGVEVVPKRVVDAVLGPLVARRDDEEDIVVLLVQAIGERAGVRARSCASLLVRADSEAGLTAMAVTTGVVLAAGVRLLASAAFENGGWLEPQRAVTGARFEWLRNELLQRRVEVRLQH
jgi:lysine 6-dehydrogenase